MPQALRRFIDRNILALGREMRWSYLPPLMVYMAAGVSGLTGIVGTFFVKDYLGLSASFLSALGFWAGIPWALKMPLGHLVDLLWKRKALLVYLGASLIALSLSIMVGLIGYREAMVRLLPAETWYVISSLLSPIGYVVQDAVADAMTVEAVPRWDQVGNPVEPGTRRRMHTTMQTLGRVAIIGGTVVVALINLYLFRDVEGLPPREMARLYRDVYLMALGIPVVSVIGVMVGAIMVRREAKRVAALGKVGTVASEDESEDGPTQANWWILIGSLVFVVFTLTLGLTNVPHNQEVIFLGSLAIVVFLIFRLTRELEPEARRSLIGTAIVIFAFRTVPGAGPGVSWWMIDRLEFDQHFLSVLSLIGSSLTLAGLFVFRRFMAERSISYVIVVLTLVGTVIALPIVGMFYGLHEWTQAHTGGVVNARFIAVVDTALDSPLGQVAMVPMLAWIANSAPSHLKATYFAVMASFTNLALSLGQLGTKYLNQIFIVTRQVIDQTSHKELVPANYTQLGPLLITQLALGLGLPLGALLLVRVLKRGVA